MFTPADQSLLNRRNRRSMDGGGDAQFAFEAAMQEASANWTGAGGHPTRPDFYAKTVSECHHCLNSSLNEPSVSGYPFCTFRMRSAPLYTMLHPVRPGRVA